MCQHKTNQRRMYQEAAKNIKAYKPYCFACIFLFLSCILIKKYGVVSLGMGFDRLTACSWCGAKWVNMVSNSIPPKTPSDESINRGLVCAHMHFIAWTQKILTFMS